MNSIKIGDKELFIYYGMAELAEFTDKFGIKLSEMASHEMTLTEMGYLIHLGLIGGAAEKDEEYSLTVRQTLRLVDKNPKLLKLAMQVFSNSISAIFNEDDEEEEDESGGDKKK